MRTRAITPRSEPSADAGVVLIVALVMTVLAVSVAVTGTWSLRANRVRTDTSFLVETQAVMVSRAGLREAENWLRRQDVQPVREFAPRLNATATPPIMETEDADIGLVREFQIHGELWGRFEVWKRWDADPDAGRLARRRQLQAVDITKLLPFPSPNVSAWQIRSVGYLYRRRDANVDFQSSPNAVIASRVLETEFSRPVLTLPAQAAISARMAGPVVIHEDVTVQGGSATGIYYLSRNGDPNVLGTVNGSPALSPTTVYDDSPETVFGISEDQLRMMADFYVTDQSEFPSPLPPLSIVFVEDSVSILQITPAKPLSGSGIVYVRGNVNFQDNTDSAFKGLLYVQGHLNVAGRARLAGSIIGQKGMNFKGDAGPVIVRYDRSVLEALSSKFENYRMSSAIRYPYSQ